MKENCMKVGALKTRIQYNMCSRQLDRRKLEKAPSIQEKKKKPINNILMLL